MTDEKPVVSCHNRLREALYPSCLRPTREVKKYYERTIRDLSITCLRVARKQAGRAVYLKLEERQFFCSDCTRHFSERFSFVRPNRTTTTRYEAYLFERCEKTPISQIAILENLCWVCGAGDLCTSRQRSYRKCRRSALSRH